MVVFQQLSTLSRTLLQRVCQSRSRAPSSIRRDLPVGTRLDQFTEQSIRAVGACACRYSVSRFFGLEAQTGVRCFSGIPPLQPPRDLVLFKYHRPAFFRVVALFCIGQGCFWVYLGQYGFSSLRDTEMAASMGNKVSVEEPTVASSWAKKLNLGSKLWRYGFTLTCFTVAFLTVAAGFLYTQRSVSQVLLHQGGKLVTIWTSAPFGSGSYFTVPLQHVSCVAHRSEVPSMIPLKIKGRPLYFLLDKQGQVFNAKLFDTTVGAYRKL